MNLYFCTMKKLVFATNNPNKLREIQESITHFDVVGLKDLGIFEDIPETGTTLKENSHIKAKTIFKKTSLDSFADDTGLEIEALNNEPGVYSARYAGENCSVDDNIQKVIKKLNGKLNRKATFKTVITLIISGETYFFEGAVDGEITKEKCGVKGFGYDPIFVPKGKKKTFGEMQPAKKYKLDHRYFAFKKLKKFL